MHEYLQCIVFIHEEHTIKCIIYIKYKHDNDIYSNTKHYIHDYMLYNALHT